ncbi:MAG: SpoIIE family protein phosphatase [Candidatus Brocadiaceae bacterium]|jgi:serine phosphatase RsbU (regulator of sigma subunit)
MGKLMWEPGGVRRRGPSEFSPDQYSQLLGRLGEATGVEIRLSEEREQRRSGAAAAPVRLGGSRTGWVVRADSGSEDAQRVAEVAAEVISRIFTVDQDIAGLSMELADRYEELNFLYEMGDRVGALLDEDEICDFVAEEAAWLLDCERASVMVVDPDGGELRIKAAVGLPEEISDEVSVRPGERISGKVFESGHAMVVNEGDPMPADSLNVAALRESNSFLSVPLKISPESGREEQIVGVINLTRKRRGGMFTASDLKLVGAVAATTATQIHNCRLINAERERQRLEHELELAARIQLSLLPEKPLTAGPVEAGGCCRPARHVGGDLFDYWVQGSHVCIIVADVSGHDIGAALMAAAVRSVVRSEAGHRRSVAGLMGRVNRALFEDLVRSELFISAFYAEIEIATGQMTFCRAGHPKPLLVQGQQRDWLDTEGMLLGLDEDGSYEDRTVQLNQGAVVVLYTDGLMEAMGEEGEYFGVEGVAEATVESLSRPAGNLAVSIVEAARRHCDGSPLSDDMTALVARYGMPEGDDA